MIGNTCEESAQKRSTAFAPGELDPLLGISSPGDRLDAGLAADRAWRKRQEDELRQALIYARRLELNASRGCAMGGLLELLLIALGIGYTSVGHDLLAKGFIVLGIAWLLLLTICGGVAVNGHLFRRKMLRAAERDAISLPPDPSEAALPIAEAPPAERERLQRFRFLRQEVRMAYRDEDMLGDVCLWAGYASLTSFLLVLVGGFLGLIVAWLGPEFASLLYIPIPIFGVVIVLLWMGIGIGLPFAALAFVIRWGQRRHWQRLVVREGFELPAPDGRGGSPWSR